VHVLNNMTLGIHHGINDVEAVNNRDRVEAGHSG
jgi:hypothetical protein